MTENVQKKEREACHYVEIGKITENQWVAITRNGKTLAVAKNEEELIEALKKDESYKDTEVFLFNHQRPTEESIRQLLEWTNGNCSVKYSIHNFDASHTVKMTIC